MARHLLKIDKLLEIMNRKLVQHDTCMECRFNSIVPLGDADESGCNWSHANLNCKGYPATVSQPATLYQSASLLQLAVICQPATVCQPIAARVIAEAKEKYNVW